MKIISSILGILIFAICVYIIYSSGKELIIKLINKFSKKKKTEENSSDIENDVDNKQN